MFQAGEFAGNSSTDSGIMWTEASEIVRRVAAKGSEDGKGTFNFLDDGQYTHRVLDMISEKSVTLEVFNMHMFNFQTATKINRFFNETSFRGVPEVLQ